MIRRLLGLPQIDQALAVGMGWKHVALQLQEEIRNERLAYTRHTRDLIEQFLIMLEKPEEAEEVRQALEAALADLSDEVARQEEHIS